MTYDLDDVTRGTPDWKTAFDKALLAMYDAASAVKDDPAALADVVAVMSSVAASVKDEYKQLCDMLVALMGDLPEVESSSGFVIEKKVGTPRKTWQHAGLGAEVARRLMQTNIDMDTGEVLRTPEELMLAMLEYAAPSYWRVKPLAAIGIVADEWCEQGEPTTNVVVRSTNVVVRPHN